MMKESRSGEKEMKSGDLADLIQKKNAQNKFEVMICIMGVHLLGGCGNYGAS